MISDLAQLGVSVDTSTVKKGKEDLSDFTKESKNTKKATDELMKSFKRYASLAFMTATLWKVIDTHREFTKSISELSAITGSTGQDLAFYTEQAKLLGSTTTFTASQVATAFKLVASAKPDLLESKEALAAVTREVLTLAEASGMQLPDAANALGSALNQFGAGSEQAARYINVLAAGAKFGASEINMTSEALRMSGSVAASLGVSFEESNAAIQALAAVAIKGSEAGTGLRGVLLKLSTQSKDEFNPEIVGMVQALKNLQDAHLTTAEKAKLFGQESITAATALINQAGAVEELVSKLTGTSTAYEQASINTNNLDGDIKALSSAWEGVALRLGETFDPALRSTTQLLTWSSKIVNSIILALQDMGDWFGATAAAVVELVSLNLDGAKAIIDARKEERAAYEDAYNRIWNEVDATAQLDAAKSASAQSAVDNAAAVNAAEEELASRRAERRQKEMDAALEKELDDAIFQEEELARQAEINDAKAAQEQAYWDRLYNLSTGSQKAIYEFTDAIRQGDYKNAVKYGAAALSNLAGTSKEMFEIQKALSLANAAVTLPSAVIKSYENGGGYPFGLIPAGLMLAAGLQQISAINSTSFGSAPSIPTVSTSAPATAGTPTGGDLPAGGTATPDTTQQTRQEVRFIFEGIEPDKLYTGQQLRDFIDRIEETKASGASF